MNIIKRWGIPTLAVIVASVMSVVTWQHSAIFASTATSTNPRQTLLAEPTTTEYEQDTDRNIVYGKPPQDLLDLITSQQQGVGPIEVDTVTTEQQTEEAASVPIVEDTIIVDDAIIGPTAEEALTSFGYARGGWESVFNQMPEEANSNVNPARTVNFSNGVSAHICWCLGMKVQTYDPAVDVSGETDEGFTFYQHPTTRDLIITDNKSLVAYHNTEAGYTWTFSYDGSRALRTGEFSFYAFANGRWTVAESSGSTEIKKDGVFLPGVFDKNYGSLALDDILKANEDMTQRFMTWFLPLNWEEVPWLQDDEPVME